MCVAKLLLLSWQCHERENLVYTQVVSVAPQCARCACVVNERETPTNASISLSSSLSSLPSLAPMVSFFQTHYSIAEPLSNFPLDRTTLTLYLARTGDMSRTSIVFYYTVDGTAQAGIDFVAAEGQAVFLPGENSTQLVVQLLANHARENDSTFLVELMTNSSSAPTSVSQEGGQAQVEVRNMHVSGVYFPALPVVASLLEDGSYRWGDLLDPNTPLLCVTVSGCGNICG